MSPHQITVLLGFSSKSDDSNTRIGQLTCPEDSYELWHQLDRHIFIGFHLSLMTPTKNALLSSPSSFLHMSLVYQLSTLHSTTACSPLPCFSFTCHTLVRVMFSLSVRDVHHLPWFSSESDDSNWKTGCSLLFHSIFRLWYPGLIPLPVTRSPLYVLTVGGYGELNVLQFFSSEVSWPDIYLLSIPYSPHRTAMQRGSDELNTYHAYHAYLPRNIYDACGNCIAYNPFIIEEHPLHYSMETTLMLFRGFLGHGLMC